MLLNMDDKILLELDSAEHLPQSSSSGTNVNPSDHEDESSNTGYIEHDPETLKAGLNGRMSTSPFVSNSDDNNSEMHDHEEQRQTSDDDNLNETDEISAEQHNIEEQEQPSAAIRQTLSATSSYEQPSSHCSSKRSHVGSDEEEEVVHKKKPVKTGRKRKLSEDIAQLLETDPDLLGVRRSGRARTQVSRLKFGSESEDEGRPKKATKEKARGSKRRNVAVWNSSDENSSSGTDSNDDEPNTKHTSRQDRRPASKTKQKSNRGRPPQKQRGGHSRKGNNRKDSDSDIANSSCGNSSSDDDRRRSTRRVAVTEELNYCEESSHGATESDECIEKGDEEAGASDNTILLDGIEKVLKDRIGKKGAIGHQTTVYNVEDRGDPNANFNIDVDEREEHFLIKWTSWSHIHNTWETAQSLQTQGVKGLKKLENYVKRMHEVNNWKRRFDKEEIEYFECEQEMNEELYEHYKKVERVIAHATSPDKGEGVIDYFVKWKGLPYAECTWEEESLLATRFQERIDDYYYRLKSRKMPSKSTLDRVWRQRPKYNQLKTQPAYIGRTSGDDSNALLLRDYQLGGVNWLVQGWCKHNGVILADEMGLGKTIQTIAYLAHLFHHYQLYGPFLIVVPLSTLASWSKEFETWAPDLNVVVYIGDIISRDLIRQYEWYASGGGKKIKFNVLLTTYEILLKDKTWLTSVDWAELAVDEAHRLKNDEALLYKSLFEFTTAHRLLITGTPLQNSLKELWALLHFIMPKQFDVWEDFEDRHKGAEKKGYESLHKELTPYLLRRVKKDVEKSLPAKVEQILRVDMTPLQKQYYKWILTKNFKALSKGLKGNTSSFLNIMMELKKCCNHSFLIRPPDDDAGRSFERLQQLLKGSGKLYLLDKLLSKLSENGHRVLIFSQMVMLLDILEEYIKLKRFNFQRLDGSIHGEKRSQALDHFNAEGSQDFCFLLSTRAGGLGINLATADTVIIFDSDWNPQNDLQAQSRAHRIGQKKQVRIYRLLTKNSVEEDIVERAKKKLVLDHLVIQRMDTSGRTVVAKNAVSGVTSTIPFSKQEVNAILKFGAAELFKEKDGEEKEPEVDIDDLLERAETMETNDADPNAELFGAFKTASIKIEEDEEISQGPQQPTNAEQSEDKEWESIIPEEQRKKIEDEERTALENELDLGPRQRKTIQQMARNEASDDEWSPKKKSNKKAVPADGSESDDSSDDDRRTSKKKKRMFAGFSEAEVRRFVRSYRKFANPLQRLEAVANDAELEEHSQKELTKLGEALQERILMAIKEAEEQPPECGIENDDIEIKKKDALKNLVVKIGHVDVSVRLILKAQKDLEPLDILVPADKLQRKHFKMPTKPRHISTWDTDWDDEEDVSLLRGVYQYGYGSWEAIKMDPELGLTEKIMLPTKTLKPQQKHLVQRVEYLLRVLRKCVDSTDGTTKRKDTTTTGEKTEPKSHSRKKPKEKENSKPIKKNHKDKQSSLESENVTPKAKRSRKSKSEISHHDSDHEEEALSSKKSGKEKAKKKVKHDQLLVKIDKLKLDSSFESGLEKTEIFKECRDLLRPVKKKLKALQDLSDSKSQIIELKLCLLKIGEHLKICLLDKGSSDSSLKKWFNYLWQFVSRFSKIDTGPLLKLYLRAAKDNGTTESSNHHRPIVEATTTATGGGQEKVATVKVEPPIDEEEKESKHHHFKKDRDGKTNETSGHHVKEHKHKHRHTVKSEGHDSHFDNDERRHEDDHHHHHHHHHDHSHGSNEPGPSHQQSGRYSNHSGQKSSHDMNYEGESFSRDRNKLAGSLNTGSASLQRSGYQQNRFDQNERNVNSRYNYNRPPSDNWPSNLGYNNNNPPSGQGNAIGQQRSILDNGRNVGSNDPRNSWNQDHNRDRRSGATGGGGSWRPVGDSRGRNESGRRDDKYNSRSQSDSNYRDHRDRDGDRSRGEPAAYDHDRDRAPSRPQGKYARINESSGQQNTQSYPASNAFLPQQNYMPPSGYSLPQQIPMEYYNAAIAAGNYIPPVSAEVANAVAVSLDPRFSHDPVYASQMQQPPPTSSDR